MKQVFGAIRLAFLFVFILAAAALVLLASLLPLRIRGCSPAAWAVTGVVRLVLPLYRVRVRSQAAQRLRDHRGLLFPNHASALDIAALLYYGPQRFLGAAEIESRFLIGWIAGRVGTVFVSRQDKNSRKLARTQVAAAYQAADRPPIVLFPEGRLGPGDGIFPFRRGGFEIAVENSIPYLTCALRYEPLEVALWRVAREGEGMWGSLWRIAQYTGMMHVEVIPLSAVQPQPGDDAAALADAARQEVADALGLPLVEAPPARVAA